MDRADIASRNEEMKQLLDIQSKDNNLLRDEELKRLNDYNRNLLNKWKQENEDAIRKEKERKEYVKEV